MTKTDDIRSQARFPAENHILQIESDMPGLTVGDISRTGVFIKNLKQLELGQNFGFKILFSMITLQKSISLQGKIARKTAEGAGIALLFNSEVERKSWSAIVETYETYRKRTKTEQTRIKLMSPKNASIKIASNLFPCIITEVGEDSLVLSTQSLQPESTIEIIFDPFTSIQVRVIYFSLDGYLVNILNYGSTGKNYIKKLLDDAYTPPQDTPSPNQIKQVLSWKQYRNIYESYISDKNYMLDNVPLPDKSPIINISLTIQHPRSKKTYKVFFETQLVRETIKGQKILKISSTSSADIMRAKKIYEEITYEEKKRIKFTYLLEPQRILTFIMFMVTIFLCYEFLPGLLRSPSPSTENNLFLTADQSMRFKFLNNAKFTDPDQIVTNPIIPDLKLSDINFIKHDPARGQTFLVIKKSDQEILLTPEIQEGLPPELKNMVQELIAKT